MKSALGCSILVSLVFFFTASSGRGEISVGNKCGFGSLIESMRLRLSEVTDRGLSDVVWSTAKSNLQSSQMSVPSMVELASHLSAVEKKTLLSKVTDLASPATREEALKREVLKLALGDETAWQNIVSHAASGGFDELTLSYMIPVLRNASDSQRDATLKQIGAIYEEAVRKKNTAVSGAANGKYALDTLLRHLTKADAGFGRAALSGEPAFEALGTYIQRARAAFPEDSNFRRYDAGLVKAVAEKLQTQLKQSRSNASVTLAGSFVNGRALPGVSDVDLFLRQSIPEETSTLLRTAVTSTIREAGVGRLPAKPHVVTAQQLANFSRKNPVIVRVSAQKIEVLIYELPGQALNEQELSTLLPAGPLGLTLKSD